MGNMDTRTAAEQLADKAAAYALAMRAEEAGKLALASELYKMADEMEGGDR